MTYRLVNSILLLLLIIPCTARANAFTDATYKLDGDYSQVVLKSLEPLDPPRIRINPGEVRFWFKDIAEQSWLKPAIEDAVVRSVFVYPGAAKTAVVRVALAGGRTLNPQDIRVERNDTETRIWIARPMSAEIPRFTQKGSEPTAEARRSPAADTVIKGAGVAAEPGAKPADEPKTNSAQKDSQARASGISPLISPSKSRASQGDADSAITPKRAGLDALGTPAGSNIAVLLIVSLVLLATYGLVRFGPFRRDAKASPASIEIIGAKRLGARHSLVLVRALGEDHLLSINAGRTEHIASIPSTAVADRDSESEQESSLDGLFKRYRKRGDTLSHDRNARPAEGGENPDRTALMETREPEPTALLHFGKRKQQSQMDKMNQIESRQNRHGESLNEPIRLRI